MPIVPSTDSAGQVSRYNTAFFKEIQKLHVNYIFILIILFYSLEYVQKKIQVPIQFSVITFDLQEA